MADEKVSAYWCERCNRLLEADEVNVENTARCPKCSSPLVIVTDEEERGEHVRAPWHFKVLVIGTAGYLVYRLIWFIFWLFHHAWNG